MKVPWHFRQPAAGREPDADLMRPPSPSPGEPVFLAGAVLTAFAVGLLVAAPGLLRPASRYAIGDYATSAIRAPWDLLVNDDHATERLRAEVARQAPPVARFDPTPGTTLPARLAGVFDRARRGIAEADAARTPAPAALAGLGPAARRAAQKKAAAAADREVDRLVSEALSQLEAEANLTLKPADRALLGVSRFGRPVERALLALLDEAYARPIAADLRLLRDAAERSRRPGEAAPLTLRPGPPLPDRAVPDAAAIDDVAGAVRRVRARAAYLAPEIGAAERDLVVDLAVRLVRPNTAYDEVATAERRAQAAAGVLPVSLTFRRNQLIVGEGGEVTREVLLVLEHLRREGMPGAFLARAAGSTALTAALLLSLIWLPAKVARLPLSRREAVFSLGSVLLSAGAFWIWLMVVDAVSARAPGVPRLSLVLLFPVTATGMVSGLVVSRRLAAGLVAVSSIVAGLVTDLGVLFSAHALIAGLVGAHLVADCRYRSGVLRAGAASSLAALVSGLGLVALAGTDAGVLSGAAAIAGAGAGAVGGALAALALSRPVEYVFGFSTRLRLVELLSYEHPLMRQFTERTPGTFQHSVSVAQLARRAAAAIGADGLLVRVGALYHDVGKMDRPEYFTENQGGVNPHDVMAPRDSARAIRDHVARGVRLLGEHRIGAEVADFVREHHGTSTLAIFEARARAAGEDVDPADYRYPGPKPRSRETAVLMLADRIEATARSLEAPSREALAEVVERTLDAVLASGQLDDSPLTLRDLAALRASFASSLADLHHTRIPYVVPGPVAIEPASPAGG